MLDPKKEEQGKDDGESHDDAQTGKQEQHDGAIVEESRHQRQRTDEAEHDRDEKEIGQGRAALGSSGRGGQTSRRARAKKRSAAADRKPNQK